MLVAANYNQPIMNNDNLYFNQDSDSDEGIDGLIAAVLQDIELKDVLNEGPEGGLTTGSNNNKDTNHDINSGIFSYFFGKSFFSDNNSNNNDDNNKNIPKNIDKNSNKNKNKIVKNSNHNLNNGNPNPNPNPTINSKPPKDKIININKINKSVKNHNKNDIINLKVNASASSVAVAVDDNNNNHSPSITITPTSTSTPMTPTSLKVISKLKINPNSKPNEPKLYPFFQSMSPKYLKPIPQSTTSITPNNVNYSAIKPKAIIKPKIQLTPTEIAIKQIKKRLNDVDEDKNGELDYTEFEEALFQIDNNLLPNDMKLIWNHCVWNDDEELRIKLFCNLLRERTKTASFSIGTNKMNKKKVSMKNILKYSFPSIYDIIPTTFLIDAKTSSDYNLKSSSLWDKSSSNNSPLNTISKIFSEMDDDDNGYIDWSEFETGINELGINYNIISQTNLELIYSILVAQQNKDNNHIANDINDDDLFNELNIKKFIFQLSNMKDNISYMQPYQILQKYFNNLVPDILLKKKIIFSNSHISVLDENDQIIPKTMKTPKSQKSPKSPNTDNDNDDYNQPSLSHPSKSVPISDAIIATKTKTKKKSKSKTNVYNKKMIKKFKKHQKFNSLFSLNQLDLDINKNKNKKKKAKASSPQDSIMDKKNCSIVVISALSNVLNSVDDDNNGKVDWQEFNEGLKELKSSYKGINASKVFYCLADNKTRELSINHFINDIKYIYKLYPHITGDQCIQKLVTYKKSSSKNKMQRRSSINSSHSASSQQTINSLQSLPVIINTNNINHSSPNHPNASSKPHNLILHSKSLSSKFTRKELSSLYKNNNKNDNKNNSNNIIDQVKNALNLIDEDQNGLIDKEEFIDFLSEFDLDEKLTDNDINLIFYQLIDDNHNEALCDLFIHKLYQCCIDHPNYSARRAVYRVCRRLLKIAQNK